MFSPSTLLTIYIAPKDVYSYVNFRNFHIRIKRRWKTGDVLGADEVLVLENNRRHNIHYKNKKSVLGWVSKLEKKPNEKPPKQEFFYQDYVGDPYYNYHRKFEGYIFDWWGISNKFTPEAVKKRNTTSVPNSPMFDPSINFDSNSLMEKMYVNNMSYDEAVTTTFKGRAKLADLITSLSKYNASTGMNKTESYNEALRMVEIIHRNNVLTNNHPSKNEYSFMINYYNKFIDKKIREMMKIQINFWFLKEVITYHPNLGLYVLGPGNMLYKIHGIVAKRDKNIIIQMDSFKQHTDKYKVEYVYSVSGDTMVNTTDGFMLAKDLPKITFIQNMLYRKKKIYTFHKNRSENFYDLILDGKSVNGFFPWFDAHHNCWINRDYKNAKNLENVTILC